MRGLTVLKQDIVLNQTRLPRRRRSDVNIPSDAILSSAQKRVELGWSCRYADNNVCWRHKDFVGLIPKRIDYAAQHVRKDAAVGLQELPQIFLRESRSESWARASSMSSSGRCGLADDGKLNEAHPRPPPIPIADAVLWTEPGLKEAVEESETSGCRQEPRGGSCAYEFSVMRNKCEMNQMWKITVAANCARETSTSRSVIVPSQLTGRRGCLTQTR